MEPPIGYGSTHSFHLHGVPIWNGYPVHLSGGWSREVQTGSMPLLVRVEIAEGVY
jgi:hypothetical protein